MPAYNFQSQFAPLVESGRKRQTIRRKRKRPTKVGDMLYLYTGMRTKACQKLGEAVCRNVTDITIFADMILLNDKQLTFWDEIKLAGDDGFNSWPAFQAFFEERYGLPFEGELIEW